MNCNIKSAEYPTGPYTIALRTQGHPQIRISHSDSGHILAETPCSGPFVHAGWGDAEVHESRGFFFVNETRHHTTTSQSIDDFEKVGNKVLLTGCLDDNEKWRWVLEFESIDDVQLGWTLRFESQDGPPPNRAQLILASCVNERIFGFGEQFTEIEMKGKKLPIISQEPGIGRGVQPLTWLMNTFFKAGGTAVNSNAPSAHFITSQHRSLCLENKQYTEFDCENRKRISIMGHAPALIGRLFYGQTPKALVEAFTRYCGRMKEPPDWVHDGAIIGMQGGTKAVEAMRELLERFETPIAAFWLQDWVGARKTSIGWQLWWNWEVDPERYPKWDQLVETLEGDGIRVMTYINPFLVNPAEKGSFNRNLYEEAIANDFVIKRSNGEPYLIQNTSFSAALLDLTHPNIEPWLKKIIQKELIATGSSGWMADFGEALPFDALLADGSDAADYHNHYPEEWSRINREAIQEAGKENDVVFFARSGFTKSPKFATLFWLGDQLTSWRREDGIKSAVLGLLSSGFSGFSLNHSDIGGYTATTMPNVPFRIPGIGFTRSKELLLRWIELNAFTAIFRTHEGNQPGRHIQVDHDGDTLKHFAQFARVFQGLLPYRKYLFAEAEAKGLPVVRHLWMEFPDDPNVLDIDLQFMLGDQLLVAPVLEPNQSDLEVYFPAGRWTHFFTGTVIESPVEGSRKMIQTPLGEPAVFSRRVEDSQFILEETIERT